MDIGADTFLWNISPGLVVVSVLGGIVAAIVKIKGSDIDEDKKNSKEDDDYFLFVPGLTL